MSFFRHYKGPLFDAALFDPPYNLDSIRKRFGSESAPPAKEGVFGRSSKGFMGKEWDSPVVFEIEFWQALKKVLKPSARVMAFGGTRTYHWMAVAMEKAGFLYHDSIHWTYATGFPKSTNISRQIDKGAGVEREIVSQRKHPTLTDTTKIQRQNSTQYHAKNSIADEWNISSPTTPQAIQWSDHGTALKPSHEMIAMAQKPLDTISNTQLYEVTGWDYWHIPKITHHINPIRKQPLFKYHTNETFIIKPKILRTKDKAKIKKQSKEAQEYLKYRFEVWKKDSIRLPSGHVEIEVKEISLKPLYPSLPFQRHYVACGVVLAKVDTGTYREWDTASIAANALVWGCGGLDIDRARIDTGGEIIKTTGVPKQDYQGQNPRPWHDNPPEAILNPRTGRFPANTILSHSKDCVRRGMKRVKGISGGGGNTKFGSQNRSNEDAIEYPNILGYIDRDGQETIADWKCVSGCPVLKIDEQSGKRPAGGSRTGKEESAKTKDVWGDYKENNAFSSYKDEGTAARFFQQCHWDYEHIDPFIYIPKASSTERNKGLKEQPDRIRNRVNSGGLENEPRFAPVKMKNNHPTCKPISLTKYLATLLLPPERETLRTIIVPFAGSGSEMIGCILAGWDVVIGIELEREYVEIAKARLKFWSGMKDWGQDDVDTILKTEEKEGQLALFEL